MSFLYLKSLHIIFVVTWFAGLFYIVRLFIYHVEALKKSEPEKKILCDQFEIMEKRLWYGITWPSAILALLFGLSMLHNFMPLKENPWMSVKLGFVGALFLYHLYCGKIRKNILASKNTLTSTKLRMFNELATLFLFGIVFLVVLKDTLDMIYGLSGFVILSMILFAAIRLYRKKREAN